MKKTCLVIRHGALGDGVIASCLLPVLSNDGYEISFLGNDRAKQALLYNPYIKTWIQAEEDIPRDELENYWEAIGKDFDKVVNLTGTIENEMLFSYPQPEYFMTMRQRRAIVGKRNYFDAQIERAGYQPKGRVLPEVYFCKEEKLKGKEWKRNHKNEFKIMWALAGSSNHKLYRYFEPVTREFLKDHPKARLFTNGDYSTKVLTYEHPQVTNLMMLGKNRDEVMSFRDAMLLAKNCDLVIGPETGLMNAVGAWKVPKICLLSHSSADNWTKHFMNAYPLQAPCWCSPCHLLFKYKHIWQRHCQVDDSYGIMTPKCTEHSAGEILNIMEEVYANWNN